MRGAAPSSPGTASDVEQLPRRARLIFRPFVDCQTLLPLARPADRPFGQVLDALVGEQLLDVPELGAGDLVLVAERRAVRVGLESEDDVDVGARPADRALAADRVTKPQDLDGLRLDAGLLEHLALDRVHD